MGDKLQKMTCSHMNAGPINEYERAELIKNQQYLFFVRLLKFSEDCKFCLQFQLLCYNLEHE